MAGHLGDACGHLLHGGGGLLGLLTLLVHAAVNLIACGAHGGGAAGERTRGLDDGADDAGEIVLHLLHGCGEGADLIVTVQVEGAAGEVARGDGVGALGDQADGPGDAASEEDGDRASDESAENGREPEGEKRGMIGAAKAYQLLVGLGHLRLGEVRDVFEEGFLERKDLVLKRVVGLRGALRGLRFVQGLDFFFERLESGESFFERRETLGVGAEIEVGAILTKFDEGDLGLFELLAPGVAIGDRGGRVDAEEHVGLERADGVGEVRAEIAAAHDERKTIGGDDVGEVGSLCHPDVRGVRTEKHGGDEEAGAEAELGFEFHEGPYLHGDGGWGKSKSYWTSAAKLTSISDSEASGAGTKRQRLTASWAAGASRAWPDSTLVAETLPSGWMVTSSTTLPLTCMRRASSG